MPKKKRPEWDFDATTPLESNRRVPPLEDECLCCGHVHRNKGGGIVRCWRQIELSNFKRRPCKCSVYGGLRLGSKKKVFGPLWAQAPGTTPYHHLWNYEQGGYIAWTLCGRECLREKICAGDSFWKKCPTCEKSKLAAKAPKRVLLKRSACAPPPQTIEELVKLYARCKHSTRVLRRRLARRSLSGEEGEILIREHLELLRSLGPVLELLSYRARQDYLQWLNKLPRGRK